jgi:raffinose/stachyose/melibiose transport system permease protein
MRNVLSKKAAIFIFVIPFIVLYTFIMMYPVFQTVIKSFYSWDGITAPSFIGLNNYKALLSDSDFLPSLKNGFIFAAVIFVVEQGVGTVLALLLSTKELRLKGSKFFRTSFFIPVVLSVSVVGQLWTQMYNYDHGLINNFLGLVGIGKVGFLSDPKLAIYSVAFTNGWQFMGIMFVFIYTAIKSIPEQYYEAATIDGASPAMIHRKITLPLIAETYKVTFTMSITGGLQAFNNMFIMTGGGPGNATMTLTYLMYKSAFQRGEFGYGCASAVILVAECLLFTLLINKFVARERIAY